MRGLIRDMLCYHARPFREPAFRVKQARNLLDFLAKSAARENSPYALLLKSELESFRRSSDSYLYHEHLEDVNDPLYFYQFAERAQANGLRYLGEVDLRTMVPANYPPEIENVLQMLAQDTLHMEQYMDFLRNRMFRQTLLCHDNLTPNYGIRAEHIKQFHVASPAKYVGPAPDGTKADGGAAADEEPPPAAVKPDVLTSKAEAFAGPDGVTLTAREPLVKAAMSYLAEVWPQALPFDQVLAEARALAYDAPPTADTLEADARSLGQAFLTFYASASTSLVELSLQPPRLAVRPGPRPTASPLARAQAAAGTKVTNLRHELVVLGDCERQLVRLLDGTRDRDALVPPLAELTAKGELSVEENGRPVPAGEPLRQVLAKAVQEQLPRLGRNALLRA